jgi:drug/metabolite transporter (DMT)-like permease
MALFGIALNQILFLSGLKRTSVAHAAVVIALTPIQILLMSVILGRERFSFFRLAGMGIALCGVAVMQTSKGTATLAGDLLVLAAGFTFAIFTIISKPLTTRFGSLPTTSLLYWAAAGLLLPLTVYEARGFDFRGVPLVAWLLVAYLAAFPSVLCYLIWYHALGKLGASRVAMFSYLQPLFATLSAIPLIGEAAGWAVAVGGVLVLGGVALAEKR